MKTFLYILLLSTLIQIDRCEATVQTRRNSLTVAMNICNEYVIPFICDDSSEKKKQTVINKCFGNETCLDYMPNVWNKTMTEKYQWYGKGKM